MDREIKKREESIYTIYILIYRFPIVKLKKEGNLYLGKYLLQSPSSPGAADAYNTLPWHHVCRMAWNSVSKGTGRRNMFVLGAQQEQRQEEHIIINVIVMNAYIMLVITHCKVELTCSKDIFSQSFRLRYTSTSWMTSILSLSPPPASSIIPFALSKTISHSTVKRGWTFWGARRIVLLFGCESKL